MLPLRFYVLSLGSMLAGATVVHNIYKPDLTIPGAAPARPPRPAAESPTTRRASKITREGRDLG